MINGVAITLDPGTATYSYTATAADTGFQITSAKFGDVEDYAKIAIYDEVRRLWELDKEIQLTTAAKDENHKLGEDDKQASYAYYADSIDVCDAAAKAYSDAATAIGKLDKDATVADKVEEAKKQIETGVKAVDEAYKQVLVDAKVKANKTLTDLDASVASFEGYAAADKASILAAAKAAIEASTTLEGLSSVIDSFKGDDKVSIGKYTHTFEAKLASFKAITTALGKIPDGEPFDEDETDKLALLEAQLKLYGVSVDSLPSSVAEEWNAKISKEVDFPVYTEDSATGATVSYKKGQSKMEVEAGAAIKSSYAGIKEELKAAILKSYFDEIEASAILGDNGKVTMKGVVSSSINTWVKTNDSDGSKKTLSQYMSTDSAELVGTIETQLAAAIGANDAYAAFGTERMTNATASVIKALKADLNLAVADAKYSNLVGGSKIATGKDHAGKYKILLKGGVTDETNSIETSFDNPFASVSGLSAADKGTEADGDEDYGYVSSVGTVSITLPTVNPLKLSASISASAQQVYDSIIHLDSTGKLDGGLLNKYLTDNNMDGTTGDSSDVLQVKALATNYASIFTSIKNAAVKGYEAAQVTANISTNTADSNSEVAFGTYGTGYICNEGMLTTIYEGSLPQKSSKWDPEATSFSQLDSAMVSIYSSAKLLKAFDTKAQAYVDGYITVAEDGINATSSDSHYANGVIGVAFVPGTMLVKGSATLTLATKYYKKGSVTDGTPGKLVDSTGQNYVEILGSAIVAAGDATTTSGTTTLDSDATGDYYPGTTVGSDATGKLVKGTNVYKALFDSTDSSSIISKVLSGVYTEGTQIDAAIKDLSDIYEAGVKAYGETAKDTLADLYSAKIAATSNLPLTQYMKALYAGMVGVFGKDYSKSTTYSSLAKKIACETCDSVDVWYEGCANIFGLVTASVDTDAKLIDAVETEANASGLVVLDALIEAGVIKSDASALTAEETTGDGTIVLTKVNEFEYTAVITDDAAGGTFTFAGATATLTSGTTATATVSGMVLTTVAEGDTDVSFAIVGERNIVVHVSVVIE